MKKGLDGALYLGTGMDAVICGFDHQGRLYITPDGAPFELYIDKEDLPELIAFLQAEVEQQNKETSCQTE